MKTDNTILDQYFNSAPVVLAISLDKRRQREHIIIGDSTQVHSYLSGTPNTQLLYDETRPLGTFLNEHEAQSRETWNQYVYSPFGEALSSIFGRADNFGAAIAYLEPMLHSKDAVCYFTATCALRTYEALQVPLGSNDRRIKYMNYASNISKSFQQIVWGDKKTSTVQQAVDRVQEKMKSNCLRADTTAQIWYPNSRNSSEWILVWESLYPVILYYLQRMSDWDMCFCRCSNCGKVFIADSFHHSLCSPQCKQERNRQNKREYDARAKKNRYDQIYTNTSERIRKRLGSLKKRPDISDASLQEAQEAFREFRKAALQKKKQCKEEKDLESFQDWLFAQERELERIYK